MKGLRLYMAGVGILLSMTLFFDPICLNYFEQFFGSLKPWWIIIVCGILGFYLLTAISSHWLPQRLGLRLPDLLKYTALAVLFFGIAVFVDWKIRFPQAMNVPFPQALLYYPVMAFIVEIILHLLPFYFLLLIRRHWLDGNGRKMSDFALFAMIALIEPSFQILMDDYMLWSLVITWLNIYFINLVQLVLFKRYGFIAMYGFRLGYYLLWHILWGYARLDLLF